MPVFYHLPCEKCHSLYLVWTDSFLFAIFSLVVSPFSSCYRPCQKVCPHLSYRPSKYWKHKSFPFSRLANINSVSLSSQETWSILLIIFLFSSDCSTLSLCPRAGCRIPHVLPRMQEPNPGFTGVCMAVKSFWLVCNSFPGGSQHPVRDFLAAIVANTSGQWIFDMSFLHTEGEEWKEVVHLSFKFFRMESLNNHLNTSYKLSHLTFF